MKRLSKFKFSIQKCEKELASFKKLLDSKVELGEQADILPFFKEHKHLSAFITAEVPKIERYDLISHEFPLYGEYQADLVVGDSNHRNYCFIEFEDAKRNSLFVKKSKSSMKFSPRFEAGFSQIIDWYMVLDDQRSSALTQQHFKGIIEDYYGILVIGRDQFIQDEVLKSRIKWKSRNIVINSKKIFIYTYDELYLILMDKIQLLKALQY